MTEQILCYFNVHFHFALGMIMFKIKINYGKARIRKERLIL